MTGLILAASITSKTAKYLLLTEENTQKKKTYHTTNTDILDKIKVVIVNTYYFLSNNTLESRNNFKQQWLHVYL